MNHAEVVLWATRFVCGLGLLLVVGWLFEHRWW